MNIRARFEEIWPVPEEIFWHDGWEEYMPRDRKNMRHAELSCIWDARLDTFTRCQETTALYVGIIEELVYELETAYTSDGVLPACVERAKRIMEQRK